MKYVFYVLFLITTLSFSQNKTDLKVAQSPLFKDKYYTNNILITHVTTNGLTGVIRENKNAFSIDVVNEFMLDRKSLLIQKKQNEKYSGYLPCGNTIKLFTVVKTSKKGREVYCYNIDVPSGRYFRSLLLNIKLNKNKSLFYNHSKTNSNFAISSNKDFFVVSTQDVKKDIKMQTVHVFNTKSFSLVYKQVFHNSEHLYKPNDLYIDNDATVYALGKKYIHVFEESSNTLGKKNILEGKEIGYGNRANYDIEFSKITAKNIEVKKANFNNKHLINRISITKKDNKIRLLGFYSNSYTESLKGLITFNVTKDNFNIGDEHLTEFPENVLKSLVQKKPIVSLKDKALKFNEFSDYFIDHIFYDDFGNIFLVAEQYKKVILERSAIHTTDFSRPDGFWLSYPTTTSVTKEFYNNLFVVKIDEKDNFIWGQAVFKRSKKPAYNAFYKEGKVHVVLNASSKLNTNKDSNTKIKTSALKRSLYNIEFDSDGKPSFKKILDNFNKSSYKPFYGKFIGNRFINLSEKFNGSRRFLTLE